MLTWKRVAADTTAEASAQAIRESLKIGNLLDHPGLRMSMGLDGAEPQQSQRQSAREAIAIERKRRFDLRRLLESAAV